MKTVFKFYKSVACLAILSFLVSCEKEEQFTSEKNEVLTSESIEMLVLNEDGVFVSKTISSGESDTIEAKQSEKNVLFWFKVKNNLPDTLKVVGLNGRSVTFSERSGTLAPGGSFFGAVSSNGSTDPAGTRNLYLTYKYTSNGKDNYVTYGGSADLRSENEADHVYKASVFHSTDFESVADNLQSVNSSFTSLIYSPYAGSGLSDQASTSLEESSISLPDFPNIVVVDVVSSIKRL